MPYDWNKYKEICYRLYIDERNSLDKIITFMKANHNFAPWYACPAAQLNKRAYQTQFKRWGFPSKLRPAHKDAELVSRIKQLWERNLSQAQMLQTLNDEGFEISDRKLSRVRGKNRWLLRQPNPGQTTGNFSTVNATLGPLKNSMGHSKARRVCRRRGSVEHPIDGTASGLPRFPSEMILPEAKAILSLDDALYRDLRIRFAHICEEEGVSKKTVAGPNTWEQVKDTLIRGQPHNDREILHLHLQDVLWTSEDNIKKKKFAFDVICTDVTKRIRSQLQNMTITEAKAKLTINPEESRTIRQEFLAILNADNFTSKSETGQVRWDELKQKWRTTSEILQRVLGARACPDHEKLRAADVFANDVMKRMRDEQTRRASEQPEDPPLTNEFSIDAGINSRMSSGFNTGSRNRSSNTRSNSGINSGMTDFKAKNHLPHFNQNAGYRQEMASRNVLDPPPVLDIDSVDLQQAQAYATYVSLEPTQPHQAYLAFSVAQKPVQNPLAIWLHLSPTSQISRKEPVWIGMLSNRTFEELKQVAVMQDDMGGTSCGHVEGILPGSGGQRGPTILISRDDQLTAYLTTVARASEPPAFMVQILWKAR